MYGARDVAAARGPHLVARVLALAPDIEKPRLARANGREHVLLRGDDAVARPHLERGPRRAYLAGLDRPSLALPLLDPAVHEREALVTIAAQREPEARDLMAALRVVGDDLRPVRDAEARHRRRELVWSDEHVPRVAAGGWGCREIVLPVAVHRPGKMAREVGRISVGHQAEAAVHDAHERIVQRRGHALGRPEALREGEGGTVPNVSALGRPKPTRARAMRARGAR